MKLKTLAVALALVFGSLVGVSAVAVADTYADCKCPVGSLHPDADCTSLAECNIPTDALDVKEGALMNRVVNIINAIVGVVSILAIIVIVIGGILFVTSTGEAAKVTRAKNTIIYGVVGLVISLLAFAIVSFVSTTVFKKTTGGGGTTGGDSSTTTEGGSEATTGTGGSTSGE